MSANRKNNQKISENTILTPANVVTIIRICLVPLFVGILLAPWPQWMGVFDFPEQTRRIMAAVVFIIISCTDWLDGYLARSRGEVTNFGKFMDPLADKILVAAALIALVELGSLPTWVVLVILVREFIVSGLRMLAASKGMVIAASYWGKSKTVFQMIAIVLFTIKDSYMGPQSPAGDAMWIFSWIIMGIALLLTVISMFDYLYKSREIFKDPEETQDLTEDERLNVSSVELSALAKKTIETAIEKQRTIATAESLTGGLIAGTLTAIPGSSAVIKGGIVSYVNEIKNAVLGVDEGVLSTEGPVCEKTAIQMAQGARKLLGTDIAVSVTGIAGPGGEEPGKPVGTVWVGISSDQGSFATQHSFSGNRNDIRVQTINAALEAILDALER